MLKPIAIRLAGTLGLFALMTGFAAAQNPDLTTNPENTGRASTATQANGDLKDYQIAKSARIGLAEAIATAEAKGDEAGGRATDADFARADGENPAHYAIKVVYPSGGLVEHRVNADTGELYTSENQPLERYFTRLKASDFRNAGTSLKDAIALAERTASGGKAYEAEVARDGDAVAYRIKLALLNRDQVLRIGPDGALKDD